MRTRLDKMITSADIIRFACAGLAMVMMIVGGAYAIPPHPDLLKARIAREDTDLTLAPLPDPTELLARGIDAPDDCFGIGEGKPNALAGAGVRRLRVLAILVDFSDQVSRTSATFFDSLVFGQATGAVHDYFDEFSYGKIDLVTVNMPSALSWTRAPQNYAYYTNNNYGMGAHPRNSQGLVEALVDAVDPVVDFGEYDNDGDGDVDFLLVFHSGTGAEFSGSTHDIWSHKWGIAPRLTGEGVTVSSFGILPEFWIRPGDMTCGIICHDVLYGFGLGELYDLDGGSNGVGKWDVMAYGAWNGVRGSSPAHPSAVHLAQLGLVKVRNVTENLIDQLIRPVNESRSDVFRLWTSGANSKEYFLIENRRKVGYDAALPGEGLLIWHIDQNKWNNDQHWYPGLNPQRHYRVALEQADGQYDLEHMRNSGDMSDPWPGSWDRRSFNGKSMPSSDGYLTGASWVAMQNITETPEGIIADLQVRRPLPKDTASVPPPDSLYWSKFYPNPFNPSTTIQYSLPMPCHVTVEIYNLLGQRVRLLVDREQPVGSHTVTWDGHDDTGRPLATGVYLYRYQAGEYVQSRKMLLLK